jgi:hypothetical protein
MMLYTRYKMHDPIYNEFREQTHTVTTPSAPPSFGTETNKQTVNMGEELGNYVHQNIIEYTTTRHAVNQKILFLIERPRSPLHILSYVHQLELQRAARWRVRAANNRPHSTHNDSWGASPIQHVADGSSHSMCSPGPS